MHWKDMADQEMREVNDRHAAEMQKLHLKVMSLIHEKHAFPWLGFWLGVFFGAFSGALIGSLIRIL
jgi:hypothetical protein